MEQWAVDWTRDCYEGRAKGWKVGDVVRHPDGYDVEITSGQFMGKYGLSNFWYWRSVDDGEKEHGYGW